MYKTATDYASERNHPEIVELLAKHPAERIASVTAENQQLREEVARLKQLVASMQAKIDELEARLSEQAAEAGGESAASREASLEKKVANLREKVRSLDQQKVTTASTLNILDSSAIKELRVIREISSGGFGKVLEVAKEEKLALKVMHAGDASIGAQRALLGEYEKLAMLHHPNVVRALGFFLSDASNPPSILLEFCPDDVGRAIKRGGVSGVQLVAWVYEIVEGMRHVHRRGLVHRDIKPSNILVGSDGQVRISDFGIAKLMTAEEQSTTLGAGTQKFMAPEILREEAYDEKADVYSFGVLLFFMLSGGAMPKISVVQMGNGKKAEIPSSFSSLARDLISACWSSDARGRPSFDEILSLLERNDFKLLELSDEEIREIKELVKHHKEEIPDY